MTKSTLSIREIGTAEGSHSVKSDSLVEPTNTKPRRLPRRIPFSVPRDQLYYWSREWQEDEAKALEELERGEGVTFHDPEEAVQWLMSPED